MPDNKSKTGNKRERENVNMSEKYEVRDAKTRVKPSTNHARLTPSKKSR